MLLEDGERDSIVVQVGSCTLRLVLFSPLGQVPPPAPVKEEGSLGVKLEDRRGLEVVGMKREREEEQEEFVKKRQRLEEGEIVPEDGFSDSEVEQTLQGAVAGLGHLQGAFSSSSNCQTEQSEPFRNGKSGFLLLARLFFAPHPGRDPRTRRSYVI